MKGLLLAFCLLATSLCFSQAYRAGESVTPAIYSRWEVAAGWSASTGEVALKNGSSSLDGQHGFYGRVLYALWKKISLGAEGTLFSAKGIEPIVHKYDAKRAGILLEYLITPDTNPRVYLLGGGGVTWHHFNFVAPYRGHNHTRAIPYAMVGAGVEISLWKDLFAAVEGRGVYNRKDNLNLFYHLSKRWETEGKLLVGIRF